MAVYVNSFGFNSPFIKEFRSNNIWSNERSIKTVYHYTSPEAFLSILSEKSIRFSDVRYMNDKSETIYVVKVILDFLHENRKYYPEFNEVVNNLIEEEDFEAIRALEITNIRYKHIPKLQYIPNRHFLFCMSKSQDSLNMWNYYVSNGIYRGYNIGFEPHKLLKTFDVDNFNTADAFMVYYGPVIYNKNDQLKEISSLADTVTKYVKSTFHDSENNYKYATISLKQYIDSYGLFFKNTSFRSEEEYRIVISIANELIPHDIKVAQKYYGENNKKMCEGFYTKNGFIVPFLNVTLPPDAISRVTISPITEANIAKESVKELLDIGNFRYNNKRVSIYHSKIPIRF